MINTANDARLLQMFETQFESSNFWTILPIINVFERFNRIGKQAFRKKCDVADPKFFENIDLWQMEEFFKCFGDVITAIDLTAFEKASSDIVIRLLLEYCSNITELSCQVHDAKTIRTMRSMIKSIETLTLNCSTTNFSELFIAKTVYPLKKLHLQLDRFFLPPLNLPNLKELHLKQMPNKKHQRQTINNTFFKLNPQIKVLKLEYPTFAFGINRILCHLLNIEEIHLIQLKYDRSQKDNVDLKAAQIFTRLKHLKRLHLGLDYGYNDLSMEHILEALHCGRIRLKHLSINTCKEEERLMNAICNLKSIRVLELEENFDGFNPHLMRLTELNNLYRIHIGMIDSFGDILELLTTARQLTNAYFQFNRCLLDVVTNFERETLDAIQAIKRQRGMRLIVDANYEKTHLDSYEEVSLRVLHLFIYYRVI